MISLTSFSFFGVQIVKCRLAQLSLDLNISSCPQSLTTFFFKLLSFSLYFYKKYQQSHGITSLKRLNSGSGLMTRALLSETGLADVGRFGRVWQARSIKVTGSRHLPKSFHARNLLFRTVRILFQSSTLKAKFPDSDRDQIIGDCYKKASPLFHLHLSFVRYRHGHPYLTQNVKAKKCFFWQ